MKKVRIILLCILIAVSFTLIACSNGSTEVEYTNSQGTFDKLNTDTIVSEYMHKSSDTFSALLDINLSQGEVEWEIINPLGEVIYKGNVSSKDGKLYKQLIYPQEYAIREGLDKKVESITGLQYGLLVIKPTSASALYKINFKPFNAEGSYTIRWGNRLPKN